MVEDFLGHPVYVAFKNYFTVNAYNLVHRYTLQRNDTA